jgi:hypothetical protein
MTVVNIHEAPLTLRQVHEGGPTIWPVYQILFGRTRHEGTEKGSCSTHVEKKKFFKNFCLKSRCKETIGRRMRRWENNNKMAHSRTGWLCGSNSSSSRHRPVAGSCGDGNESLGSIKCRRFTDQFSNRKLVKRFCSVQFVFEWQYNYGRIRW